MASAQVHRPSQICLTLYPKLSAWYIRDTTDMLTWYQNRRYNIIKQVLGIASYLRLRSLRSQICLSRVLSLRWLFIGQQFVLVISRKYPRKLFNLYVRTYSQDSVSYSCFKFSFKTHRSPNIGLTWILSYTLFALEIIRDTRICAYH